MRAEAAWLISLTSIIAVLLGAPSGAPAWAQDNQDKAVAQEKRNPHDATAPREIKKAPPDTAAADSSMALKGSEEGTVFKTLTIEGEDRVRIEFERPPLSLNLDPLKTPGLDWGDTREMLARTDINFLSPLVGSSAGERSPYLSRPWLEAFASGKVVRFRPALTNVERWRMTIADSRSQTVAVLEGKGAPPNELGWDGRSSDGKPMPPGFTYSYVLEAYDKAGNKRNFVGNGFELPPYEIDTPKELVLLFSGKGLGMTATPGHLGASGKLGASSSRPAALDLAPAALVLDAASRINQVSAPDKPIRVAVTARTHKEADALAKSVAQALQPLLFGAPSRIQCALDVQPASPATAIVTLSAAK